MDLEKTNNALKLAVQVLRECNYAEESNVIHSFMSNLQNQKIADECKNINIAALRSNTIDDVVSVLDSTIKSFGGIDFTMTVVSEDETSIHHPRAIASERFKENNDIELPFDMNDPIFFEMINTTGYAVWSEKFINRGSRVTKCHGEANYGISNRFEFEEVCCVQLNISGRRYEEWYCSLNIIQREEYDLSIRNIVGKYSDIVSKKVNNRKSLTPDQNYMLRMLRAGMSIEKLNDDYLFGSKYSVFESLKEIFEVGSEQEIVSKSIIENIEIEAPIRKQDIYLIEKKSEIKLIYSN